MPFNPLNAGQMLIIFYEKQTVWQILCSSPMVSIYGLSSQPAWLGIWQKS
jgi:hypothetical protein